MQALEASFPGTDLGTLVLASMLARDREFGKARDKLQVRSQQAPACRVGPSPADAVRGAHTLCRAS